MELYAARHGESVFNLQQRLAGKEANSPLTKNGVLQAEQLGKLIKNIKFDAVYSSPLNRAIDTSKIALNNKYKIMLDDRLAEISFGDMNGLTYEEASDTYPNSGMLFLSSPTAYETPPNGESLEDIINRVSSFLDDLVKKDYDKVFIQAHGYVLRVLYACCADKAITSIEKSPIYPNCALVHYTYDGNKWSLSE